MAGKANGTHVHEATCNLAKAAGGIRGIARAMQDRQDDDVSDLGNALDILASGIEREIESLASGD